MSRNALAAIVSTALVIVVVILGFHALGSPQSQRLIHSDLQSVRALDGLSRQIHTKWVASNKTLPADLQGFPKSLTQSPITQEEFSYRRKSDSQFELCANFAAKSPTVQSANPNESDAFWSHPKGNYCFRFDAAQEIPPAPYYY